MQKDNKNNIKKIQDALKKREIKIINRLKRNSPQQEQIIQSIYHRNHAKPIIIKQGNKRPAYTKKHETQKILLSQRKKTEFLTTIIGKTTRLNLRERGSFNASILKISENKILCVYRNDEQNFTSCFMSNDLKIDPKSFHKLNMKNVQVTDPRLIITPNNKVLMSYSRHFDDGQEGIAANIILNLNNTSHQINIENSIRISPNTLSERQKNWIPFVYENEIYFIATICPHRVYKINFEKNPVAELFYSTDWNHAWFNNNSLRGNTTPLLLSDGNYLSTFHTSTLIKHTHFYDNGFYVFEGKPPFRPLYCSYKTFLCAEDAKEPYFRKHNQILCPFPVGMIYNQDKVLISYGDNDSCVKILEVGLENIYKTMVKI